MARASSPRAGNHCPSAAPLRVRCRRGGGVSIDTCLGACSSGAGCQANARLCVTVVTDARFRSSNPRTRIGAPCGCSPSATSTATSARPADWSSARRGRRRDRAPATSPPCTRASRRRSRRWRDRDARRCSCPATTRPRTRCARPARAGPRRRCCTASGTEIDGAQFFGLGAGVPTTPWDWSFDLTEEEAAERLDGLPRGRRARRPLAAEGPLRRTARATTSAARRSSRRSRPRGRRSRYAATSTRAGGASPASARADDREPRPRGPRLRALGERP